MTERNYDWAAIAGSPKFLELHHKKTVFLVGLWLVGALSYFTLTLGVGFAPDLLKMKVMGRINFGHIFCLFQFLLGVCRT